MPGYPSGNYELQKFFPLLDEEKMEKLFNQKFLLSNSYTGKYLAKYLNENNAK